MQQEKKVIIVTVVLIAIVAVALLIFFGYYTNWYKTHFSTFYLVEGKTKLFTDVEGLSLRNERIAVHYDFVKDKSYTVQVLPTGEDFSFTVDGVCLSFLELSDLTPAFNIVLSDKSFSIRCKNVTMQEVLSRLFPGRSIEVDEEVDTTPHFKLVVATADGKHSVCMTFRCYHQVTGVGFEKPGITL